MHKSCTMAVGLALAVGLVGCRRSDSEPGGSSTGGNRATTTSPAGSHTRGAGTLIVKGRGSDLYYAFKGDEKKPVGFAKTGAPLSLPPGAYSVSLGNSRCEVRVAAGKETSLASGSIQVRGVGQDLFEVFDETGEKKLAFTTTNGRIELLEGAYVVKLNNSVHKTTVDAGQEVIIDAGAVTVEGEGKELFEVYDRPEGEKLGFAFAGKLIELLPGRYSVKFMKKDYTAVVKPREKTVISPGK
ncbi:MAG: hypothetical protein JXQ73_01975 [Phycisphaerae bacterium]|nr:hypothetical protein [Phycisphaerae bacterium]